jgi:putative NADH-flavin reductase
MRIALFGATGQVGGLLLDQALERRLAVTAFVRDPNRLSSRNSSALRVVTADVMDPEVIAPGLAGADAVVNTIGSPGRQPSTVTTDSSNSIIAAMKVTGVRRLVSLSGSMVDATGDGPLLRFVAKPIARRVFSGAYHDLVAADRLIHESGLEWTIVRPPRLTDDPGTGTYRTALDTNLPKAIKMARADVAAAMLGVIDDLKTIRRHVYVA